MKKLLSLVVLISAVGTGPRLFAQWGWGGNSYHASTYEEGVQRGAADVVRSAGMANLMNSKAAINYQEASSAQMDNRLKWTKTYFEMRRYNKDYREAEKGPRPTSEQLFRLAKQATPKSMSPAELNPVTGSVDWPALLKQDAFTKYRTSLDELFVGRAQAGGKMTMEQFNEILKNLSDMQIILKRQISSLPPQVFSSTNAFIKRLEHEIKTSI